jgi:hypothetical protein
MGSRRPGYLPPRGTARGDLSLVACRLSLAGVHSIRGVAPQLSLPPCRREPGTSLQGPLQVREGLRRAFLLLPADSSEILYPFLFQPAGTVLQNRRRISWG